MIFHKKQHLFESKASNVNWIKVKGQNNEKFIVNDKTWISYEDHDDIAAKVIKYLKFYILNL